jgi:hypothetical protein
MSRFLSSTLAIAALVTVSSAALADSYYGPRQVGNKCYQRSTGMESAGYWADCPATGGTANASIRRPARANQSGNRSQTTTQPNQRQVDRYQ